MLLDYNQFKIQFLKILMHFVHKSLLTLCFSIHALAISLLRFIKDTIINEELNLLWKSIIIFFFKKSHFNVHFHRLWDFLFPFLKWISLLFEHIFLYLIIIENVLYLVFIRLALENLLSHRDLMERLFSVKGTKSILLLSVRFL